MTRQMEEHRSTLIRFALVGGLSSLLYSLMMAAIVRWTQWPVFISSVVLFCLFIPVTFHAHKRFTYLAQSLRQGAFAGYAALQIACFSALSYVSSQILQDRNFAQATLLYFGTVTAAAVLSFLVGRYLIFRAPG